MADVDSDSSETGGDTDTDNHDADVVLTALVDHLAATAERPMRPDVTHWVAEAEAVASDVVGADLPANVVRERIAHVRELLSHVDDTGDAEADTHVAAAKSLTDELLGELD